MGCTTLYSFISHLTPPCPGRVGENKGGKQVPGPSLTGKNKVFCYAQTVERYSNLTGTEYWADGEGNMMYTSQLEKEP